MGFGWGLFFLCSQSGQGIKELLEVAKKEVPTELWKFTPLVLKATAGLRLLPGEKAQKLLDKVLFLIFRFAFQKFYDKNWSLQCKVYTPLSLCTLVTPITLL